jgi:antitoxin component YwqK of YwqJK toxin-antitoxin module
MKDVNGTQIQERDGLFYEELSNKLFTGEVIDKYGLLTTKTEYEDGVRCKYTLFTKTGKIRKESDFKNKLSILWLSKENNKKLEEYDGKTGIKTFWDVKTGLLKMIMGSERGTDRFFDKDGVEIFQNRGFTYNIGQMIYPNTYPTKDLLGEMFYEKEDKLEEIFQFLMPLGKIVLYYENGQKSKEINYKNGKLNGSTTFWHKNGQKSFLVYYINNKIDGKRVVLNKDGFKTYEESYKNGELHGKSICWHENGQKWFEIMYQNGKQVGRAVFWNPDGSIAHKSDFF